MDAAPLFSYLPKMPKGGEAAWLHTADGLRLRAAFWKTRSAKGTVFIFPGRTEWIEKYGPAAQEFMERGYSAVTIDWRGHGLADRLLEDPRIGHVGTFFDYQKDVDALVAFAKAKKLPQPWFVMGHSMGGAIAVRSILDGKPFKAAGFSGPMWGIGFSAWQKTLVSFAGPFFALSGTMNRYAPGTNGQSYMDAQSFEGNLLTADREMYEFMAAHMEAHPEMIIGGPSTHWVYEALKETAWMRANPAPAIPSICYLGMDEEIVDTEAVRAYMRRFPNGELVEVPRARHEFPMEVPNTRKRFYDGVTKIFDANL